MDDVRARLLQMISDPRVASDVPGDEARRLLAEIASLQTGLGALQGVLLPAAMALDSGGTTRQLPSVGLSVKAAADRIGVSASLVYKHSQTDFASFCRRVRGRIVCDSVALDKWLRSPEGMRVMRRAA